MSKPVGPCLLIGAGAVAVNYHLPRLRGMTPYKQFHLLEVDTNRREQLAARFADARDVRVTARVPADARYGLVVIATPPKFHRQYVEELAGRTPEFLVEKPLTITAEDGRKLAAVAAQSGARVTVNLIRRIFGGYALMRDVIAGGELGALRSVRIAEGTVFNWDAVSMGSFSRDLNGGGVLMDLGPHVLDLLLQTFDGLTFESCRMDAPPPRIEANCHLRLRTPEGVPVRVLLSRNRNLSNRAVFTFERGRASLPVIGEEILLERDGRAPVRLLPAKSLPPEAAAYPNLFTGFYEKFILTGSNQGVDAAESLKHLVPIEAAYQNAAIMGECF